MPFEKAPIAPFAGLFLLEFPHFTDERGSFAELLRADAFADLGLPSFSQHNVSVSKQGVLRGLHWQAPPFTQSKLVFCLAGKIFDVAVDLRRESATFGRYFSLELCPERAAALFIPTGFAHGFYGLEASNVVSYYCSCNYEVAAGRTLHYADQNLAISWPFPASFTPTLSASDATAQTLEFYLNQDEKALNFAL